MTPEVSAAVGASPAAGPQQRAQQPAPNLPGVPEALADKENVVRPNEVALLQRLAQAEASREQLLAQLAARDRELAAARKLAQQPAPQAAPQAGRSMRDATHIAEITAALAAANHGLCSVTKAAELQLHAATTEARRAQASLATALEANMANLEATLAVKRDAMARVERVMAEADEKLRMQAMLAREREHMLLLEAGRLQQVAAQWEARARSLEARMVSAAAAAGPGAGVGAAAVSPAGNVAQDQPRAGQLRVLLQPPAAAQAAGGSAGLGTAVEQGQEAQRQQQEEQPSQGAPRWMAFGPPPVVVRLGRADGPGVAQEWSAAPPPPPPAPADAYAWGSTAKDRRGGCVAYAGGAQVADGPWPAPRPPAGQHFGMPADCSSLDMLAAIAAALIPVAKPRSRPLAPVHAPLKHVAPPQPAGTDSLPKRRLGRPRKNPLPPDARDGAARPVAGVPDADTAAAAGAATAAGAAREGDSAEHPVAASGQVPVAQVAPPDPAVPSKRGRGRPPKRKRNVRQVPADVAAALAAAYVTGLNAQAPGSNGGVVAGAAVVADGCSQQEQEPHKRARLHNVEMHVTARQIARAHTSGPRLGCVPGRAVGLPASTSAAAAGADAAYPGQEQAAPWPAGAHAAQGAGGPGCGGKADQETACITISSSSSEEAGDGGAGAAGEVVGPQAVPPQVPCGQAGSATSDGGRSCSGSGGAGGNSTDTTPFSPSQVLADVSSAEAARKRARAAAACVAAVTAAPPPDHEDASGAGGVEEPAGVEAEAAGRPCCGAAATAGHASTCASRGTAAAAAAATAPGAGGAAGASAPAAPTRRVPGPAEAASAGTNATGHARLPPAPAPEPAGPRKAHMGLGAAEEVMRRLYLGVLASARAVPQAAAAFETRAELEQLPGFAQCVAAQVRALLAVPGMCWVEGRGCSSAGGRLRCAHVGQWDGPCGLASAAAHVRALCGKMHG